MVVIATRHNLHAVMTTDVLKAGKNVFVEKPLCLNQSELERVIKTYNTVNVKLMVGFNRRFSPSAVEIKKKFINCKTPLMILYRVNAGQIPEDHWIQDVDVGGGRIIGEVCHFVDLLQFITDSKPTKVYASSIKGGGNVINEDNINIVIDFENGSSGNIIYTSLGSKSFAKEYVEIFGGRSVKTINNFKIGKFGMSQDKGYKNEFVEFIKAIKNGESSPIPIESIYYTTLTTFKIKESLEKDEPVQIN